MSYYTEEIKRLKDLESREKNQEEFQTSAEALRDIYNSFVNAGFTEEQAYELLTIQLKK